MGQSTEKPHEVTRSRSFYFSSRPAYAAAGSTPDLTGIAYEQKPGARLPLQSIFRDDTGRAIRLSDLFEGRPMILALGYFHCPKLCSVVRGDLFDALRDRE